jgi:hypothetical protein
VRETDACQGSLTACSTPQARDQTTPFGGVIDIPVASLHIETGPRSAHKTLEVRPLPQLEPSDGGVQTLAGLEAASIEFGAQRRPSLTIDGRLST